MMVTKKVIEDRWKVSCAGVIKGGNREYYVVLNLPLYTCHPWTPEYVRYFPTLSTWRCGSIPQSMTQPHEVALHSKCQSQVLLYDPCFHPQAIVNTNTQPLPYSG